MQCAVKPAMPSKITTMQVTMETKYGILFPETDHYKHEKLSATDREWLKVGDGGWVQNVCNPHQDQFWYFHGAE